MSFIILRDFEVNKLQKDGVVQIRRAMKVQPPGKGYCPFKVGKEYFVKETWRSTGILSAPYAYKASDEILNLIGETGELLQLQYRWKSPIIMPREASRFTIVFDDVTHGLLRDMTIEDAEECGAGTDEYFVYIDWANSVAPPRSHIQSLKEHYGTLWDWHNRKSEFDPRRWENNPHVWIVRARCK